MKIDNFFFSILYIQFIVLFNYQLKKKVSSHKKFEVYLRKNDFKTKNPLKYL